MDIYAVVCIQNSDNQKCRFIKKLPAPTCDFSLNTFGIVLHDSDRALKTYYWNFDPAIEDIVAIYRETGELYCTVSPYFAEYAALYDRQCEIRLD